MQLPELLEEVCKIAKKASAVFLDKDNAQVLSTEGKDIKLLADIKSQELIISALKKISGYPILSEESNEKFSSSEHNTFWVIDPLDGTYNFKKGIPFYCLSIGLWKEGKPSLGVIYDFKRDMLYKGCSESKAYMNEQPIIVSEEKLISQSSIATGFPIQMDMSQENLNNYVSKLPSFKKIRMLGSAATSLAYVASGNIDIYFEQDIFIWDVTAGLAIINAAGGEFTMNEKGEYKFDVLVSNKNVHSELRNIWMN